MLNDDELMKSVTEGDSEALQELHRRYAPLVFHLALQSVGQDGAEEIVQDVFLQVWRKASVFDPQRGHLKPWLLQMAHFRILNELRRRSRRPELQPDQEVWEEWPDAAPEPQEATWKEFRKTAVREAVDRLPSAQRQALSLAFFEELTHDQVASTLRLPLGTVKTRIRTALLSLRRVLAPIAALVLLAGLGAGSFFQYAKTSRALTLVSSSHAEEDRLTAAPGMPAATHGWYKNRPGTTTAVLLLHQFPNQEPGSTYQGWAKINGRWISVGTGSLDRDGNAVIIAEGPDFAFEPEAVLVTREPWMGSASPHGPVIVSSSLSR